MNLLGKFGSTIKVIAAKSDVTQPELRLGGREDLLDCQFCELVLFKNLLGKHASASDESFQSEMNLLTEVDMNLMDKASWFSKHPGKLVEKLSNTPLKRWLAGACAGQLGGYNKASARLSKHLGKLSRKFSNASLRRRIRSFNGFLGGCCGKKPSRFFRRLSKLSGESDSTQQKLRLAGACVSLLDGRVSALSKPYLYRATPLMLIPIMLIPNDEVIFSSPCSRNACL